MESKEIENPGIIFSGPGVCPKCGTPLYVVDSEMTLMELAIDGSPISEETNINCKGVCPVCDTKYPMMRWGGKYIPYCRTTFILRKMELIDRINERKAKLSKSDKNPFGI